MRWSHYESIVERNEIHLTYYSHSTLDFFEIASAAGTQKRLANTHSSHEIGFN